MKLKIFIVPTLFLLIVILCVWLVYPAYSNGANGLKEKNMQLKKEQNKLKNIQNKNIYVKKIADKISSSMQDIDILYKFIPFRIKGEEIEDNLNYLASSAGLSVLSINLVNNAKNIENKNENFKNSSLASLVDISMNVSGDYEALKKFIDSINRFRRYNNIKTLIITRNKNIQNNNENETNNINNNIVLNAKLNIEFIFLTKNKLTNADINNPIFSNNKLDMSVINQIKKEKNTNVIPVSIGGVGKTNPFIP